MLDIMRAGEDLKCGDLVCLGEDGLVIKAVNVETVNTVKRRAIARLAESTLFTEEALLYAVEELKDFDLICLAVELATTRYVGLEEAVYALKSKGECRYGAHKLS